MPHDLPLPNLTGQIPYDAEEAITRLRDYGLNLAAAQDVTVAQVADLARVVDIVATAAGGGGGGGGASALVAIQQSIQIITDILTATEIITESLVLLGFTPESVIFIGNDSQLAEDPGQLLWKAITNRLGVGVADPLTQVDVAGTITARTDLQVMEPGGVPAGAHVTGWRAPALAADVLYTLPNADGVAGQVQSTDGAAALAWVPGAIGSRIVTKVANYVATALDYVILGDASGGAFTITLPAASSVPKQVYNIKKIDASPNAVTVDGDGTETIDGALTQVIATQFNSLMIVSDLSNWHII